MWYVTLLLFYGCYIAQAAVHLHSFEPNHIEKDFGNMIHTHTAWVTTSTPLNTSLMYFAGPLYEPFDRTPPSSSWVYCKNKPLHVVVDHSRAEGYVYGCCERHNQTRFRCPIPPPPLPDLFRALPRHDEYAIYALPVAPHHTWSKQSLTLTYYQPHNVVGVLKQAIACLVLGGLVAGSIVSLVATIHKWGNMFPRMFFLLHMVVTGIVILVEAALLEYLDAEQVPYIRAGLVHSLWNVVCSLLVIYVPSTHAVHDQRIRVEGAVADCLQFAQHPIVKEVLLISYTLSMALQGLSTHSLIQVLWGTFDASFEIMVALALWYWVVSLVFTIAFVTGLYNVHVPLKLGANVQVQGDRQVVPTGTQRIGIFQPASNTFVPARLVEGVQIAVAPGEGEFSLHAWDMKTVDQRRDTCTRTQVVLPQLSSTVAIVYEVDEALHLRRIGSIRERHRQQWYHQDYSWLLSLFTVLLRLSPIFEADGEYQLNTVEILRREMYECTGDYTVCGQPLYGIVYWGSFWSLFSVGLAWLLSELLWGGVAWWVYAYDVYLTLMMTLFVVNVATKKIMVPSSASRGKATETWDVNGEYSRTLHAPYRVLHLEGTLETGNASCTCPARHAMRCFPAPHHRFVCDGSTCTCPQLTVQQQVWYCATCNYALCMACAPPLVLQGAVRLRGTCKVVVGC